mmetsp:Transcript_38495/g.110515  ORF Transcript_38495/g.110515 Transcript_38495/m.110515 type:complete len:339 (+) Transcript_38495:44-1060(+)
MLRPVSRMAKLLSAVAATALSVASAYGDPYMFTITGACDYHDRIDGSNFVKQGQTASGAPYYKAMHSETYIYYDPDCMASQDGTPRWIIGVVKPSTTSAHDLDGDGFCDYIGRIDSTDTSRPPTSAEWTMHCHGTYRQQYIFLLEGTTTAQATASTPAPSARTTTQEAATTAPPSATSPKALLLSGAWAWKGFMNGQTLELAGYTADGSPFYKGQTTEEYLYYDPDCDGAGTNTEARWVLDDRLPSTTAAADLDADGTCKYHARAEGQGAGLPPPAAATWRMYCGSAGWTDVQLSLKEVSAQAAGAHVNPKPDMVLSSATRTGGVAAVALAACLAFLA